MQHLWLGFFLPLKSTYCADTCAWEKKTKNWVSGDVGGRKGNLVWAACGYDRKAGWDPECYQLTLPWNPKINWLKGYAHVCAAMLLGRHGKYMPYGRDLNLIYCECGNCAIFLILYRLGIMQAPKETKYFNLCNHGGLMSIKCRPQ